MLNTGLTLRKPRESTYGAAHRFLAVNPGIKTPDMLKELRGFRHDDEFSSPGYYSVLAQRHEQQFCEHHHLPYIVPDPTPKTLRIRNCAQCAAMGYHSMIYQWEWLTYCPIHKTPLMHQCPVCSRPWPSVSELLHRHCGTCGWPISRQQLIQSGAFTASPSWSDCEVLQSIKEDYQSLIKVRLTALDNSFHALDEHQSVSILHRDFASIYAQQFPRHHRQLLSKNISFKKIKQFTFPFPAEDKKTLQAGDLRNLHQQVLIQREYVATQILATIETYRQRPLDIQAFYDMEFFGLNKDTDSYLLAFLYWRKLITTGLCSNTNPPRSKYFETLSGTYPLIPIPMCYLAVAKDSANDPDSGFALPARLPAPLDLTLKVYELDLWWCFKSLLKYFDTVKTHWESVNVSPWYQALPEWATPGGNYNDVMGIFLNKHHELELLIPMARLKYSLDDLGLMN